MAKIDSMLLSMDDYIENANTVKEITLGRLLEDKVISEDQAREYAEKWQAIIVKNSWFKRWFNAFRGGEDAEKYSYKLVRFED